MTTAKERIDQLLNEIEEKCQPADCRQLRIPFMLDCASLISKLPSQTVKALQTSRAYSIQELPLTSVSEAVAECWRYLDGSFVNGSNDDHPDAITIRALICILLEESRPGSEDFIDLIGFFLDLLNRVEPHAEEQWELIKKHFQYCLGS
jgi:hypothetical protein